VEREIDKEILVKRSRLFILAVLFAAFAAQGCESKAPNSVESVASETPSTEIKSGPSSETPAANVGAKVSSDGVFKTFSVYSDASAPDNHFVPSGWMGDYGDIKMNEKYLTLPHGGSTSIQIVYGNAATQGARWAGIYWQNPPNNWGTRPGGYDLTGAKKLTFWVRGEKGGERLEEVKIGGITGEYADSDVAGIGPIVLTTEWQQFTIDLEGKDLSSISGGFCWATNLDVNPEGATFYFDDIKYEA
jgi:hypothetical protein